VARSFIKNTPNYSKNKQAADRSANRDDLSVFPRFPQAAPPSSFLANFPNVGRNLRCANDVFTVWQLAFSNGATVVMRLVTFRRALVMMPA
jgi:hypothetical protein